MKLKFKIKEVKPHIFLFEFTDQYNMCMTFLRYQEYYESPNPKFRRKCFNLLDYIEWYSRNHDNSFTYASDWGGFNIPSEIVPAVHELLSVEEVNKFDEAMFIGYDKCISLLKDKSNPFYIIGAKSGQIDTIKHEIAHGFFYTVPEYKKEMTKLVKKLPKSVFKKVCKKLKDMGYTQQVYIDECQAYFSTGGVDDLFDKKFLKYTGPFIDVFHKYDNQYKKSL